MARLVQFIFFCAISAIVFSWLARQTGMTVINWSGWEIELQTSLLVAGVAVLIAGLFLLYRLIRILVLWPGWMGHNWQVRRQKKGERALSLGMVAFAAGDHKMARRQARKAEKLLGSGLLPDLLSAQAAHAAGDAKAALRYFTALSRNEDTAYFGHLGLMRLYQEQGKEAQSLDAAHKALATSESLSPATIRIFAHDLDMRRWREALDRLGSFLRQDAQALATFGPQDGLAIGQLNAPALLAGHLCILLSEDAAESDKKGYLEQALDFSPRLVEASRRLALLASEGQRKSALKRLEKDFKAFPHPQLAELIAKLSGDNEGQLVARLGRLADASTNFDEARLIAAEYALESGIWASASAMLAGVTPAGQTNKYFLLLADLAEKKRDFSVSDVPADYDNSDRAEHHLEKEQSLVAAAHAPHAANWQCQACDKALRQWDMVCPSCAVLGQVDWQQSGHASHPVLPPA
ncbi:MAG: heme biosynthesis HemY N-terminal domain-containing protein [Candidatus Puniceispirillaceae bacterium]